MLGNICFSGLGRITVWLRKKMILTVSFGRGERKKKKADWKRNEGKLYNSPILLGTKCYSLLDFKSVFIYLLLLVLISDT